MKLTHNRIKRLARIFTWSTISHLIVLYVLGWVVVITGDLPFIETDGAFGMLMTGFMLSLLAAVFVRTFVFDMVDE